MVYIDKNEFKDNMPELLIVTYADSNYYKFVIPFIAFASYYNRNCIIEIVVDHVSDFSAKYAKQLGSIYRLYNNFIISQSQISNLGIYVNNIRFFHNTDLHAKYVYICDIDILIMDDILKLHLPHLEKHNIFYSNIVRTGSNPPQMTGLHFIEYDRYYPVCAKGYDLRDNDEVNLYKLMVSKFPDRILHDADYRPVPGIHISLNRSPFQRKIGGKKMVGWEFKNYASEFMKLRNTQYYHDQIGLFDLEIRHLLILLEYVIAGKIPEMSLISLLYGLDYTICLPAKEELDAIGSVAVVNQNFVFALGNLINDLYNKNSVGNYLITLLKCGCSQQAIALGTAYLKWNYNRFMNLQFVKQIHKPGDERQSDLEDAAAKFTDIYKRNAWGSQESKSGPGSTLAATQSILFQLPQLFTKYKISFLLDAGCGDMNWMRHLLQSYQLHYCGIDIVPDIILANNEKYANSTTMFICDDIRRMQLPMADGILCRDCLFHFSYASIQDFLRNFMKSKINYIFITNHVNNGFLNSDIKTGQWRLLDFFLPPFSFPTPLEIIHDGNKKQICLWNKNQLANLDYIS